LIPGVYREMHVRLDDKIPFLEIFVIPYFLWFFFIAFCVVFPIVKYEREEYWRFAIYLASGMTLFLVISTFFPNYQGLRPEVMPRDNILCDFVQFFYRTDTPTNVFPSMHVYNAIGGAISICRSRRIKKPGKYASVILAILIVLSTMFIKQHSVIDVVSGMGLSIIFYYLVYRCEVVMNLLRILGLVAPVSEHVPPEIPAENTRA
jgi:membrane-associated phospholipid phosphatase